MSYPSLSATQLTLYDKPLNFQNSSWIQDTGQLTINTDDNMYFYASQAFVFGNNTGSGTGFGGCIYALGTIPASGMGHYTYPSPPGFPPMNIDSVPVYNSSSSSYCHALTLGGVVEELNGNMLSGGVGWSATAPGLYLPSPNYGFNSGTGFYSLVCAARILCAVEIDVASDSRIKFNIKSLESTESLQVLRELDPVTYNYKDFLSKGTNTCYGFIAQKVKEIHSDSVSIVPQFIPSIYEPVLIENKNIIKLMYNKSKTVFEIKEGKPLILKLYIVEKNNKNGKEEEKEKEKIVTVKQFIDDKTIEINEELEVESAFLFGQEVDDFHVLNYDNLNLLAISSIKQLDKELQEKKQSVQKKQQCKQAEIDALKSELNSIKELLSKIKI